MVIKSESQDAQQQAEAQRPTAVAKDAPPLRLIVSRCGRAVLALAIAWGVVTTVAALSRFKAARLVAEPSSPAATAAPAEEMLSLADFAGGTWDLAGLPVAVGVDSANASDLADRLQASPRVPLPRISLNGEWRVAHSRILGLLQGMPRERLIVDGAGQTTAAYWRYVGEFAGLRAVIFTTADDQPEQLALARVAWPAEHEWSVFEIKPLLGRAVPVERQALLPTPPGARTLAVRFDEQGNCNAHFVSFPAGVQPLDFWRSGGHDLHLLNMQLERGQFYGFTRAGRSGYVWLGLPDDDRSRLGLIIERPAVETLANETSLVDRP